MGEFVDRRVRERMKEGGEGGTEIYFVCPYVDRRGARGKEIIYF